MSAFCVSARKTVSRFKVGVNWALPWIFFPRSPSISQENKFSVNKAQWQYNYTNRPTPQNLSLRDRMMPFDVPAFFMQLAFFKCHYGHTVCLGRLASRKRCQDWGGSWQCLGGLLAISTAQKWGLVRKPSLQRIEENQSKPSTDAGAGLGDHPWAKINAPWQWDKMLILAPARGRQPKSQLCWSNELGDLRGLRPP